MHEFNYKNTKVKKIQIYQSSCDFSNHYLNKKTRTEEKLCPTIIIRGISFITKDGHDCFAIASTYSPEICYAFSRSPDVRHIFSVRSGSGAIGSQNHKARMLQRTRHAKKCKCAFASLQSMIVVGDVVRDIRQQEGGGKRGRYSDVATWFV